MRTPRCLWFCLLLAGAGAPAIRAADGEHKDALAEMRESLRQALVSVSDAATAQREQQRAKETPPAAASEKEAARPPQRKETAAAPTREERARSAAARPAAAAHSDPDGPRYRESQHNSADSAGGVQMGGVSRDGSASSRSGGTSVREGSSSSGSFSVRSTVIILE